jgi:hypothetical protein
VTDVVSVTTPFSVTAKYTDPVGAGPPSDGETVALSVTVPYTVVVVGDVDTVTMTPSAPNGAAATGPAPPTVAASPPRPATTPARAADNPRRVKNPPVPIPGASFVRDSDRPYNV